MQELTDASSNFASVIIGYSVIKLREIIHSHF